MGNTKQLGVLRLRQTDLSDRNNVMPEAAQEGDRGDIDVLVGEKLHGVVARRISSAATTSMAYWMHARMSSGSRSA